VISAETRTAIAETKTRLMNEKPDSTLLSRNIYTAEAMISGRRVLMNILSERNKAQVSTEIKHRTIGSELGGIL